MKEHVPFSVHLKYERELRGWSQADVAEKIGSNPKTVNRWESGSSLPHPYYRQKFCELFGKNAEELGLVSNEKAQPGASAQAGTQPQWSGPPAHHSHIMQAASSELHVPGQLILQREDWGEAPLGGSFYGRTEERSELLRWIVEQRCRVVALVGLGGIGKSSLAAQVVEQVKDQFRCVFWRSLQNAPPLTHVLRQCLRFVSAQQSGELPERVDDQVSLLLRYFQEQRCLLVLDNMEALLRPHERAGLYREGYQDYGLLLQRLGEAQHQSCLLLTSREKPRELPRLEGPAAPVRSLALRGVDQAEGQEILRDKGLSGSLADWALLIEQYAGNPLALKLVSESIRELFGGDIARFLQQEEIAFGDITELLEQHFARLSIQEQEILYWLAIEREAVPLETLQENLIHPTLKGVLLEALDSLKRRFLLETRGTALFTLQPVIMEYVTGLLVQRACSEFVEEQAEVWRRYALLKAQAKDYVRESQQRLILAPVAEYLQSGLGTAGIVQQLEHMLKTEQERTSRQRNYVAGNALNLLIYLRSDLRNFDFSHQVIWQAYLQNASLPGVNFAQAYFIASVFTNTFGNILSVAFSPRRHLLAAGSASGAIWIYRALTGTPLLPCLGHSDCPWSLAFSPDERLLVSGSDDQTVRLWDVATGECLHILSGHTNRVRGVAFSPDGRLVASGSDDSRIYLWDVSTGACLKELRGHTNRVWSVAFSPNGSLLASGSTDQALRLWDVETGECLKVLTGHADWIRSVAFNSDGRLLASASDDHHVHLWDVATGECLRVLSGHTNRVWSLAFQPGGTLLASGSEDHTVRLWDAGTGACMRTLSAHTHGVRSVAISSDGRLLASSGDDQAICVWDMETGSCLRRMRGYTNRVRAIACSSNGRTLVSASEDMTIRLWDLSTSGSFKAMQDRVHNVLTIACSPVDHLLASAGEDHTVRLWDGETGRPLRILTGHTNWVRSVSFRPDGRRLASGGEDQSVRVWDIETGSCLHVLKRHTSWVRAVAFSPDGSVLASGGDDQVIHLWDGNTGHLLSTLAEHTGRVRAVAFSPDGSILASGSEDQTLRLWDVQRRTCTQVLQGHSNWARSIAFSPDGSILASGSDDHTVRLWDPGTGQCLHVLQGHTDRVRSLVFNPISRILMSGSDDGTIRLWDPEKATCLATLINERPYEGMHISGVSGLPEAQKNALRLLGAVE